MSSALARIKVMINNRSLSCLQQNLPRLHPSSSPIRTQRKPQPCMVFLYCSWLPSEKQHFETSHHPKAKPGKRITFWHGPGTDVRCDTAPGFLSIMVTRVELDAIAGEMPQARDHQRLLRLHFFKRLLLVCVLGCCCGIVWRGCDGGYHHGGIGRRAKVSSFSRWPIK